MLELSVDARDDGFIHGLSELIRILEEIKDSSNDINNALLIDNKNG
jgi:hypothetical protein